LASGRTLNSTDMCLLVIYENGDWLDGVRPPPATLFIQVTAEIQWWMGLVGCYARGVGSGILISVLVIGSW